MECVVEGCNREAAEGFNLCLGHINQSFRQAEEDEEFSYPEY